MEDGIRIGQDGELESAVRAGKMGDPVAMVKHLYASKVLDKLAYRVHKEYFGKLGRGDIDECLAEAVANAFQALTRGERITALVAYLLKATRNMACDMAQRTTLPISAEIEDSVPASQVHRNNVEDRMRDELRERALAHARKLLPLIGQENIRRVMEVILDAIEQGIVDLTDSRIAELTDLQEETVRRLKNRAFQRLRQHAEAAGFDLKKYQILDEDDEPFNTDELEN